MGPVEISTIRIRWSRDARGMGMNDASEQMASDASGA
jgi:hypothetical protein